MIILKDNQLRWHTTIKMNLNSNMIILKDINGIMFNYVICI